MLLTSRASVNEPMVEALETIGEHLKSAYQTVC